MRSTLRATRNSQEPVKCNTSNISLVYGILKRLKRTVVRATDCGSVGGFGAVAGGVKISRQMVTERQHCRLLCQMTINKAAHHTNANLITNNLMSYSLWGCNCQHSTDIRPTQRPTINCIVLKKTTCSVAPQQTYTINMLIGDMSVTGIPNHIFRFVTDLQLTLCILDEV